MAKKRRPSPELRRKIALEEIVAQLCAMNCTLQSIATSLAQPMPDEGEYTRLRALLDKLTSLSQTKEPEHGNEPQP